MARVIAICNAKGGVGKCMAPGTPVLLSSGETAPIERLFKENFIAAGAAHLDESGGVFVRPKKPLVVFSLDENLSMSKQTVDWIYRGKASRLVEVKSNRGKTACVTPEHPFLAYRRGGVTWVRAEELEVGDYIAAARRVDVAENGAVTDLTPHIPDEIFVRLSDGKIIDAHLENILSGGGIRSAILSRLLREGEVSATALYGTANKAIVFKHLTEFLGSGIVSRRRGTHNEYFYAARREAVLDDILEQGFSVKIFRELELPRVAVRDFIYRTASGHVCLPMRPVFALDAELARFVALVIAEGYLGPSRIIFFNSSRELVEIFTSYCAKLGMPFRQVWLGTQWKITVDGAGTLMKFLEGVFEIPRRGNRKSFRVTMPQAVLRAPQEVLAAYLGAYIDSDGYVARDRAAVEITSASYENIVGLQYAFLRFGINAQMKSVWSSASNSPRPKRRMYHTLIVSGSRDLSLIRSHIFLSIPEKRARLERVSTIHHNTNVDVVPSGELIKTVRHKLGLSQSAFGFQGTITDYEDGSNNPSRAAFEKITAIAERSPLFSRLDSEMMFLSRLAHSDVFWERVSSVTPVAYDGYVYDLTVASTHNFVAGHGAFVMHNTTTAVNLSAYLAVSGRRVLLVDFDPQANASSALGSDPLKTETSIYHGLLNEVPSEKLVKPTALFNFHFIPAAPHLAGILIEFVNLPEREHFLRKFLHSFRHQYDYIIIDLPPSLSLLTINGLIASDEVLIPVQAEYYSLEGIGQLLEIIGLIQKNLRHHLRVNGALLTMYDKREHLSREVGKNLRTHFPHSVFETEIPRSVALAEAPSFSKPILLYRPDSTGAVAYRRLAEEIISQEKNLGIEHGAVSSKNFGNFNV